VLPAALMLPACDHGCEPHPEPPPRGPELPARPAPRPIDAGLAQMIGVDADVPVEDPPAPAGDLKAEVDAFTTVEACVAARATLDPVVGDAIDAIGYDSLLHDACRVLLAIKKRDIAECEPIVSSSLREHCTASVAIVVGDEGMCPLALETHDPLCVALARRDSRLCTAVSRTDRALCRAILAHDAAKCEGNKRCARLVARWSGLVSDAAQGPELGTRISMTVTPGGDAGDEKPKTFDLSMHGGPATVRRSVAGTSILLGEASTKGWPPTMIAPEPRLSLVLSASPSTIKQGRHAVTRDAVAFVMLAPKTATMSSEDMTDAAVLDVDLIGLEVGAPVRFTLEVSMPHERGGYRVRLEVNTFVRDVVSVGR
jgi:hypothetical protein